MVFGRLTDYFLKTYGTAQLTPRVWMPLGRKRAHPASEGTASKFLHFELQPL